MIKSFPQQTESPDKDLHGYGCKIHETIYRTAEVCGVTTVTTDDIVKMYKLGVSAGIIWNNDLPICDASKWDAATKARVAQYKANLDQQLKDGKITQEYYNYILPYYTDWWRTYVKNDEKFADIIAGYYGCKVKVTKLYDGAPCSRVARANYTEIIWMDKYGTHFGLGDGVWPANIISDQETHVVYNPWKSLPILRVSAFRHLLIEKL